MTATAAELIAAHAAPVVSRVPGTVKPVEGEWPCFDCPPPGYPTDKTRCEPCPRAARTRVG